MGVNPYLDVIECTYSIPLLGLCSTNKSNIDMRIGRQAWIERYKVLYIQCTNNTMH